MQKFLLWWTAQLTDLLPLSVRAAVTGSEDDAAILELDGDAVGLLVRRKGVTTCEARAFANERGFRELAASASARSGFPKRLIVRSPTAPLLQKRLSFPKAARRNLDDALAFEIDRET